MAVKKSKNVEVEVVNPVEEIVEKAVEAVEEVTPEIVVDPEATEKSVRKEGNVRIRMREDHKCTIAMVRYDLKKGECYHVPENVKKILDEHGLLAPLN